MVSSLLKLAALVVLLVAPPALALECYTCTLSDGTDDSCLTDPDNSGSTPITECKLGAGQCCFISRSENYTDPGTPVSMFRGCVKDCEPDFIGKRVIRPSLSGITYEFYCYEDLCNNGPGDTSPGGGGDSSNDEAGAAGVQAPSVALGLLCLCLVWNSL